MLLVSNLEDSSWLGASGHQRVHVSPHRHDRQLNWEKQDVRGFTRDDIIAHRFPTARRKGYDTLEVDGYLEHLAEYIGWMQQELARHQASERTALDLLHTAQRVADETVVAAQLEADGVRRHAAEGLDLARRDARQTLDFARAEADRIVVSAQEQAESAVQSSRSQIAELEAAAVDRARELNRLAEELRDFVTLSAAELRRGGSHLLAMADHFQLELADRNKAIGLGGDGSIDLREKRVDVT